MRNPRVKRLADLARHPAARDADLVFIVEGPVLVSDAVASGLAVEEVFVEADALDRPAVAHAVEAALAAGAGGYVLDGSLKGRGATTTPNGIVAVVRRPRPSSDADAAGEHDLVLVLVEVADPGNVGTLVRVAEACGASRVVVTAGSADPWSPKCVRSSAGSSFRVPIGARPTATDVLADLGTMGYRRVGTRAVASTRFDDLRLDGRIALVLGSEAHGLPDELDPLLDVVTAIPMAGRAESLNVAMAGAILGFKVFRDQNPNLEG